MNCVDYNKKEVNCQDCKFFNNDSMRKRVHCFKRVSKPTNDKRLPLGVYDEDINDIVATWSKNDYTLNCPILLDCDECGRCIRK